MENSSLQQFQALLAPLGRFTKALYKLKVIVPRTLLHTSTQYGGLGIPDLLQIVLGIPVVHLHTPHQLLMPLQ